jgi:hypothetical protein
MTPLNMARHRNSPHMAFWKMLKQGHDHFEVTKHEPKVDVCDKRYVFDAESSGKFSAAERCPAYTVPEEIVTAVRDKQRRDETQTAELINRGTPAAPVRMGVDGGMNQTFLAAVKSHGGPGATIRTAAGTIPPHVNPPGEPSADAFTGSTMSLASAESKPASAPRSSVQVASAAPASSGGGFFSNLFGSRTEDQGTASKSSDTAAPKTKPAASAPKPAPSAAGTSRPKSDSQPAETKTASVVAPKASPPKQDASAEPQGAAASAPPLLNGAAPTMSSSAFDGRFGSWR